MINIDEQIQILRDRFDTFSKALTVAARENDERELDVLFADMLKFFIAEVKNKNLEEIYLERYPNSERLFWGLNNEMNKKPMRKIRPKNEK